MLKPLIYEVLGPVEAHEGQLRSDLGRFRGRWPPSFPAMSGSCT